MNIFKVQKKHLFKFFGIFIRMAVNCFPRNGKLIVYGGALDMFIDNAKYMFIYNIIHMPDYDHVWITKDPLLLERLRKKNLKGIKANCFKGWFCMIRAGFIIFDNRISDFSYYNLSEGSVRINIWHGVFFKMLGATIQDIDIPYKAKSHLIEKFILEHQKGDYGICTSHNLQNKYSYAFKLPINRIVISGYPRNRILLLPEEERMNFIEKYEEKFIKDLYKNNINSSYRKVVYMPTFRDNDKYYINEAILDWNLLNQNCVDSNVMLFVKVHRMTPLPEKKNFSNIKILDSKIDIYPLLPMFDMLVTDYSSIIFDFSLLKKPIVLYTFDMDSYIHQSRKILMSIWKLFEDKVSIVSDFNSFMSSLSMPIQEKTMFPTDYFFDFADNIRPINDIIIKNTKYNSYA